jgi:hypothetical protein
MVILNEDVKLAQPKPAFGAVMGKNKLRRWVLITILWVVAAIWFVTLIQTYDPNGDDFISRLVGGLGGLVFCGGIVYLGYTSVVFSHKKDVYKSDARAGMYEWARTDLRDYLNARYGTNIDEDQAQNLLHYSGATIVRTHKGERTWVRVVLRNIENITQSVHLAFDGVRGIPDVNNVELELCIIEKPKPEHAKVYEFYQD